MSNQPLSVLISSAGDPASDEQTDTSAPTTTTTVPPPAPVTFGQGGFDVVPAIIPIVYIAIAWWALWAFLLRPLLSALRGEADQPAARRGVEVPASITGNKKTFWTLGAQLHRFVRQVEVFAVSQDESPSRADVLLRQAQIAALGSPPKDIQTALSSDESRAREAGGRAAFAYLVGQDVDAIDSGLTMVRKSFLMTSVACLLIALLAGWTNTSVVLLIGAVGAIAFRLMRNIKGTHAGLGTEWASILAVPACGALAAFGGTLVVHLAFRLELVGGVFGSVSPAGQDSVTLALAFLLGFSERFLDSLATATVDKTAPPRGSAPDDSGAQPGAKTGRQADESAASEDSAVSVEPGMSEPTPSSDDAAEVVEDTAGGSADSTDGLASDATHTAASDDNPVSPPAPTSQ